MEKLPLVALKDSTIRPRWSPNVPMVSGAIIFWNWHSIIHSVTSLLPILPTNSAEEPFFCLDNRGPSKCYTASFKDTSLKLRMNISFFVLSINTFFRSSQYSGVTELAIFEQTSRERISSKFTHFSLIII